MKHLHTPCLPCPSPKYRPITHLRYLIYCFIAWLATHSVLGNTAVTNPNWKHYRQPQDITRNLAGEPWTMRRHYQKYFNYRTPNGKSIKIYAQRAVTDEQLLRSANILDFYLTNVPGKKYGHNRQAIANHMSQHNAILIMPAGADEGGPITDGQPLYQLESPIEGSRAYINNDWDQRDASFEEIFHLVHDYGIGTKYSPGVLKNSFQVEISQAMRNARKKGLWAAKPEFAEWIDELAAEGSLEQEYIAAVLDSYYGYWGALTENPGGMGGLYVAKTRIEIKHKDPMGYRLMQSFFPEYLSYMARISADFEGTFNLSFNPNQPYTHKSQYLKNVQLLGNNHANLKGNNQNNIFMGNLGNNVIDGQGGYDIVQLISSSSHYKMRKTSTGFILSGPEGKDILINIELLRFTDKDQKL